MLPKNLGYNVQMTKEHNTLRLKRLGIDTYREAVIYMRRDCVVCQSEGFEAQARVAITLDSRKIVATLNIVSTDILQPGQAGLSEYAWELLDARDDDQVRLAHAMPLQSLSDVRSKIYGKELDKKSFDKIIEDVTRGRYADIHISAFLTACAAGKLSHNEVKYLTQSMFEHGETLSWNSDLVVDKHCVGGLPGNRTSLIIVPIVTAFGLMMPKTSSRAITSPAGSADTMEVLAPVKLSRAKMRDVVEKEGGCIAWGGSSSLSPADDMLIRVERSLDLDSEGQLVASVLSKKIAAGSTCIVIDIPIGITAKVRSQESAETLRNLLETIGSELGVEVRTIFTDGSQPVGRGIGPSLEAQDVLDVLQNKKEAPQDLRQRALTLAGHVIEFSPDVNAGDGLKIATELLDNGQAWKKFQDICEAQGGMRMPTQAAHTFLVTAEHSGTVGSIDNRLIARLARLAGAPRDKSAGISMHVRVGDRVEKSQPLFTVHAESQGELNYSLLLLQEEKNIIILCHT